MVAPRQLTAQRTRRQYRVRNRVRAIPRVRLTVYRTNRHIYAQLIDDSQGRTLASASTQEAIFEKGKPHGDVKAAEAVGKLIAERGIAAGVKLVAFDRGAYRFHGRVAALAAAARMSGLDF